MVAPRVQCEDEHAGCGDHAEQTDHKMIEDQPVVTENNQSRQRDETGNVPEK